MVKSVIPERTSWMAVPSPESPPPTMSTDGVRRPWRRASSTARRRRLRPMSSAIPNPPVHSVRRPRSGVGPRLRGAVAVG